MASSNQLLNMHTYNYLNLLKIKSQIWEAHTYMHNSINDHSPAQKHFLKSLTYINIELTQVLKKIHELQ